MKTRKPMSTALGAIAATLLFLSSSAYAQDSVLNESILLRTNEILKNLKDTKYSHTTVVDEEKGKYHLDCSGLAFHVLQRVAPHNLANVPTVRNRPLAFEFYELFAKSPRKDSKTGWLRVTRLMDAKPGDLLCWRKETLVKGKTTGHIMIIAGMPVRESDGRIKLEVIHSSSSTRRTGLELEVGENGVETRTIWCAVDEAGKPVSVYMHDQVEKPIVEPISIGRASKISAADAQPGKAYLQVSMNSDKLKSDECTLDPNHPFLQRGVKEGDTILVTRHDKKAQALFRVRFRQESPGSWLCIRLSKSGRKRLGYDDPKKEELTLTMGKKP